MSGGMEKLERLFYESKPYLCLAVGIYAVTSPMANVFVLLCALALLFAGTLIIRSRFQNRRGTPLEKLWYEAQPFLYLGIAGFALIAKRGSSFAVGCALLLLFCATMILQWRYKNRR